MGRTQRAVFLDSIAETGPALPSIALFRSVARRSRDRSRRRFLDLDLREDGRHSPRLVWGSGIKIPLDMLAW